MSPPLPPSHLLTTTLWTWPMALPLPLQPLGSFPYLCNFPWVAKSCYSIQACFHHCFHALYTTLSPFDKTITLCCTCLKILNNKKKTYTCKCTYSFGDLEAVNMFFHHVTTHTKWKENVNLCNFQKQGLHMPSTSKHQPPTNL